MEKISEFITKLESLTDKSRENLNKELLFLRDPRLKILYKKIQKLKKEKKKITLDTHITWGKDKKEKYSIQNAVNQMLAFSKIKKQALTQLGIVDKKTLTGITKLEFEDSTIIEEKIKETSGKDLSLKWILLGSPNFLKEDNPDIYIEEIYKTYKSIKKKK